MPPSSISAAVGRGGANRAADVKIIQRMLNNRLPVPYRALQVSGICDAQTLCLIDAFQRHIMRMPRPDGRIDPGGKSLKVLAGKATSPVATIGRPFMLRIEEFRTHVQKEYGIIISISSDLRDPVWQHRMHVAHMIKYNSFGHQKPRKNTVVNGRALISIDHLRDAKVAWGGGIQPEEFLRDAAGQTCRKKADLSGYDPIPDEAKTRARALEILSTAGVATAKDRSTEPHSAMVACGVQGCAEPCACGGSRSRHLAGQAVDLNRQALGQLKSKLNPPKDSQLDKLLMEFGLKRPMPSEPWHVEPNV